MQRYDGPQEAAEVHDEERVVRRARKAGGEGRVREVGEEVERVLEEIHDLVVHGRGAAGDVDEIALHVREPRGEPPQRRELLRDARRERRRRRVLDIAQQVLDADLLRLLRLDRRRRMQERLARFRAVLRCIDT